MGVTTGAGFATETECLSLPWWWCLVAKSLLQSHGLILKEINPEYSLEVLMLKLWPPDVKIRLIGKDPDAGKD